ncbi:beta-N-acetylhexosaminidase [Marinospirillum alkaliphilum DSM 21637]|uniref:beta-N-acetylhexosaminidase n=2 Tax=Marinospirillum TaxID=64968 RepID=A0A1K1U6A6_9GAMM|nr:beta-N-acetylhexosaminidase [Marinospirillum alkaliphilum DSM 21637]
MLDLEGPQLTDDERLLLQREAVGGVILFARNIINREQVEHLTAEICSLRPELLLAVDQEGGRVQRLKEGFTRLPAMRQLGCLYDLDASAALEAARLMGQLMAAEVIDVGLDISFAPVLDLDYGQSEVIGDRAFASDTGTLIRLAEAFIDGMHRAGMAATGKHYPGHGHVAGDSHTCLPVDHRSMQQIRDTCLKPFVALAPRLQGIMPAHVIYTALDDRPAGFSRPWLDLLRKELKFSGMVFSDDLTMAGAGAAGDFAQRAEAALSAGCDQVLVCNDRAAALQVLEWLESSNAGCCEAASGLKANPPTGGDWLASPEALLARQLAGLLVDKELQAALHLLV